MTESTPSTSNYVDAFLQGSYNPDVLSCLANLSNDEVFTPPEIANKMIDMLPSELFSDPKTTFLDPVCKSGVFLREIAKRLIVGLKDKIPDLRERVEHIMRRQLFGVAITELTSLAARRTLYCSKYPNGDYSIVKFDSPEGNIRFKNVKHTWENGKCIYCGASEKELGDDARGQKEKHAYEWIHTDKPEDIFKMKFDVIIGNPPYQMADGGAAASALPLYDKFVQQAQKLSPQYLSMIIPSRWFSGGKGLDDFRDQMLQDKHLCYLVDYPISNECFNGVSIKGGVCYFLWTQNLYQTCKVTTIRNNTITSLQRPLLEKGTSTFIRYNEAVPIYRKVADRNEESFSQIISSRKPFGLSTAVTGRKEYFDGSAYLYENKKITFFPRNEIPVNTEWINKPKILISYAYGAGEDFPHQIINKPFIAKPNSVCTETYLVVGPFENEKEANNVLSYMKTKFFRFLVLLLKNTQHATKQVYKFVPQQDFTRPWTDADLYAKYGLNQEEIDFIESMIRPMEL